MSRRRIVVLLITVVVVAAGGAGYLALTGIPVDATRERLVGTWRCSAGPTFSFHRDGTLVAEQIDSHIGISVSRGSGTWTADEAAEGGVLSVEMAFNVDVGRATVRFSDLRWLLPDTYEAVMWWPTRATASGEFYTPCDAWRD